MGLVINELSPTPKSLPTKGYNNGERMELLVCGFRERKREIFFNQGFSLDFSLSFFFPSLFLYSFLTKILHPTLH